MPQGAPNVPLEFNASIELTSAQILALHETPIAFGISVAGRKIIPLKVEFVLQYGGTGYTGSGVSPVLAYSNNNTVALADPTNAFWVATGNTWKRVVNSESVTVDPTGADLVVSGVGQSADLAAGNSTVLVNVIYILE